MKNSVKHYLPVVGLLAAILTVAVGITALTGQVEQGGDRPMVMTTTYPLYLAAKNITAGTDTAVATLSGVSAGCLHDYQLSPADRLALQRADCVLMNGAGAEVFLEGLALPVTPVDTSAGLALLCAEEHHHDHDHDHGEEGYNEHLWMSPTLYRAQVAAAAEALCAAHPEQAAVYGRNAASYEAKIEALEQRLAAVADSLGGTPCVIFHSSLSYFAQAAGLTVEATLTVGEESGVSAGDLSLVQQLAAASPDLLLLYDSQYPLRYAAVDKLVPAAQVLALDTAVTGENRPTDWIQAMEHNIALLERRLSDKGGQG